MKQIYQISIQIIKAAQTKNVPIIAEDAHLNLMDARVYCLPPQS